MKILAHAFTMIPTNDLARTAAPYVGGGLEFLWRPDPQTAIVGANERAFVMIEDDSSERALGAGPVLLVDDVSKTGLGGTSSWVIPPMNVPVGKYGAVDCDGTVLRYLDLSMCSEDIPSIGFGNSGDERVTVDGIQ
ncbi:hypothetical protein D3I60_06090 [Brevibacterium permense]|uniref:hypothetical protein n=1 Tax=Brevibacterium permense TaxID=234834 RepID=UPI0021CEA000|nr:hypothetical protein [Brevibacterium permense]MCU4296650.1 hypothetical protein [Brevibacterium permense]